MNTPPEGRDLGAPLEPVSAHPPAPTRSGRRRLGLGTLFFGFVGPLLCFLVGGVLVRELFERWFAPMFVSAVVAVIALAVQLARPRLSPERSMFLTGVLATSAAFALIVGLLLLPFSLMGLVVGIGVLGLVPLGTAWVLGRAALEAVKRADSLAAATVSAWMLAGASFALFAPAVPVVLEARAYGAAFEELGAARPDAVERASAALPHMPWISPFPLRNELELEGDEARLERLKQLLRVRFHQEWQEFVD